MVSRDGAILKANGLTLDDVCQECGGNDFIINPSSEYVCSGCGIVHSIFYENAPKRYFGIEEKNKIETYEIDYKNPGSKTIINKKDIKNGVPLYFLKLIKINSTKNLHDLSLSKEIPTFYAISTQLEMPKYITEESIKLFSEIIKQKLMRGYNAKDFVASCLFFAGKNNGFEVFFDDIINQDIFSKRVYKIKELVKKNILPKFGIKINEHNELVKQYILKACNYFNNQQLKTYSISIYNELKNLNLSGLSNKGLAGGILYAASKKMGLKLTQAEIAKFLKITDVTLRIRYKEINNYLSKTKTDHK